MKKNLMVISPYEEFSNMIEQVSANFIIEPMIINGENLDKKLKDKLYNLVENHYNPDVIIGRGVVTTYASKLFKSSSIVRIEPNFIDIMYALRQARNHGDKAGIITYYSKEIEANIDLLKEIFDFKAIQTYLFQNSTDLEQQILKAKNDGMNSIIGGGTLGHALALKHEIPSTFVKTSISSVLNAMEQSVSIINSRQFEKNLLDNIFSIINCMNEGLLATKDYKVFISNSKLDEILNVPVRRYCNKDIRHLNKSIRTFIENKNISKDIIKINDKQYLLEKLDGKVSFADNIIIFRSVSELQDKEVSVRKKLHANKYSAKYTFKDIIGSSPMITSTIHNASIFAQTDAEILITGDTGTGKELFAQSIHNHSKRKDNPFIAINCGAIPEQLLESELFGYEDGAFSGAKKGGKSGLFELAHKGTLFLDEINSLPITLQGKLLRVVQEKKLRRIGSEIEISIDTRIIAATNKKIDSLIQKNKFRSDLYHRLNTLTIALPNLNERIQDIELLANYFIDQYSIKYNKVVPYLKKHDISFLKTHHWTGNVRELENVIHRYVILYNQLGDKGLSASFINNYSDSPLVDVEEDSHLVIKKDTLEKMEREIIISLLNENRWSKNEVATKLGISRSTLWRKLKAE